MDADDFGVGVVLAVEAGEALFEELDEALYEDADVVGFDADDVGQGGEPYRVGFKSVCRWFRGGWKPIAF